MKRMLKSMFRVFGRKLFVHSTVVLLLFFGVCRLYQTGFWVCLLAFFLGQLFLGFAEFVYGLLMWGIRLIREVFSGSEIYKDSV